MRREAFGPLSGVSRWRIRPPMTDPSSSSPKSYRDIGPDPPRVRRFITVHRPRNETDGRITQRT
jgi:hypothetical protein